jgi:thiol-disulfide isomerase/thioredoxin
VVLAAGLVTATTVALAAVLYVTNRAPSVPALTAREAAETDRPYLVKLHAQWCPVCMMTKDVWSELSVAYERRVRFAVFDFTNDTTTAASRVEAARLGLSAVFDEYVGETGTVLIVDGRSREVLDSVHGARELEPYHAAIDQALARTPTTR